MSSLVNKWLIILIFLKVPDDEVNELVSSSFESSRKVYPDFNNFSFIPRMIPVPDSTGAMFSMFSDLGMLTK